MGSIRIIKLPDIGEGVVEGEVITWFKNVGDKVQLDEPVVSVMTDKATVELPSPFAGTLAERFVEEGKIAFKDKPLYSIQTDSSIKEENPSIIEPKKKQMSIEVDKQISSNQVEPEARRITKTLNIDLTTIEGTGKDGRITTKDLHQKSIKQVHIESFEDDQIVPLKGIPRLMAEKMALSKREAPHFSYFEQIDATHLIQLKDSFKKAGLKENIHITFMPFIIKAVSLCLNEFPKVNSTLDMENGNLRIHQHHHIGIAVSVDGGLIVPVLKNVESMPIETLIRAYDKLITKSKNQELKPEDLKGSTITISNFGSFGGSGRWATPIINFPEVAILALAKIQKQPMVKQEKIAVRDALNISWSFDHRVIDGYLAANFSHFFRTLLENPSTLL